MLGVEIKENVAAGDDLGSGVVVLDVIGTEAHAAVGDVHVVVGDVHAADAPLGSAGGDFGDAAGGRRSGDLLGEKRDGRKDEEECGQAQAQELAQGGDGEE
jgi:hypothetical protein